MQELLFLAHRIPYPPNKGDKLRSYNMLRYLSQRYRVHLGCFVDSADDRKYITKVKSLCYETCFVDQSPLAARLRSLRGLASGEALSLPYYRDAGMAAWVARVLRRRPVHAALVFSSPMAQYLMAPGAGALRRVVDFVDVDSEKWRQYAEVRRWPMAALYRREARALLAHERSVAQRFESASFVSQAEAALFRRLAPESGHKVSYFNNGVDADYFSPHILQRSPFPPGAANLVFTGAMDYWPNIDAVQWFAREVFAPLCARLPALGFYIVGARPPPEVRVLARQPGVVVTGTVADVRPYLAHASVCVAPLRIARGVQNKVLEAMAMQKVVLVSPQALEGISARPGSELLVAEGGPAFIAHIEAVLAAPSPRAMALAARARVLADYSWSVNLERLSALLAAPLPERAR
ncbi:MAG: TIGR03087 family PEP-CTERM/XrtA system glycosyltransferase [Pseudomonadota bacterium]